MDYKVIRSGRRTMAAEIKDAGLIIRAPYAASDADIENFVMRNAARINKLFDKVRTRQSRLAAVMKLTDLELRQLADAASKVIPERVAYYAPLVGVTYGRITVRRQRTRWGSCSSKGNLNFNCLLMLAPPEVIDSVVVHELCHRIHMDHSTDFYEEVLRVFPDYRKWNTWLREHGTELMAML